MTIMGIFIALFLVMMFPPMALIAVCAVVVELLVFAIFRSYKNDWACAAIKTIGRALWRARCICRSLCRFCGSIIM